jgi:hypothetical protein
MDAEVARRVFGRTVLGMAACQSDPDCCVCVDLAWSRSEYRETFERPVMLSEATPWPSEKGRGCGCMDDHDETDVPLVLGHAKHCPMLEVVPAYSTDIEAAWRVVSHMRDQRFWLQVQDMRRFDVNEWEVEFASAGRDGWAKADTLPLAISMAALAAVDARQRPVAPILAPRSQQATTESGGAR